MSNSENLSAPTKPTSGRPAYSPALYQIQSAIAKLLVSFRCKVKIWEGQAGETAWCYGVVLLVNILRLYCNFLYEGRSIGAGAISAELSAVFTGILSILRDSMKELLHCTGW